MLNLVGDGDACRGGERKPEIFWRGGEVVAYHDSSRNFDHTLGTFVLAGLSFLLSSLIPQSVVIIGPLNWNS